MRCSVIIPVYNVAGFIGACLDSIAVAAGGRDIEVVCVDDGSTDASGKILDDYAASPRISSISLRVIHQANAGVSAARNRGMEVATGDWQLFVDADDMVRSTLFATLEAGLTQDPTADLLGFGMVADYVDSPEWRDDPAVWKDIGIEREIADSLDGMSVYRFAYRRDRFGSLRFQPYAYGEDLMFVVEALVRSRRCLITDRPEYAYRWRPGSASHIELSPRAAADLVSLNVASFRCLGESGKRIARGFILRRGGIWIEELPRVLIGRRTEPEWNRVWNAWLDSMAVAADLACLTERQRRMARKVAESRTVLAVRLHCLLPAWLRRKGLWTCS